MKLRTAAAISFVACIAVSTLRAGTISLGWDAVSDADLAGYRVYHDTVPGAFGHSVDVGMQLAVTLQGLANCTNHEVAVKAYDAAGQSSPSFSNVVSGWPRPEISGASPSQLTRGTQVQLTLAGTNFQTGAQVKFSDAAITATNVSVSACTQIVLTANVGSGAALGAVTLRVVNPDTVYGEAAGLVTVVADQNGPTITGLGAGAIGGTTATISWTTSEPADGRVFFRRQGETGYQATAVDATLLTSHAIALTGLLPSTLYQFHVTSKDAGGNETSSGADATFTTQSSSFTYLRLEAEAGTMIAPVSVKTASDVYSSKMIEVPTGSNGTAGSPAGESRISFHVPQSGNWRVWARTWCTDPGGISWYEGVDGGTLQSLILPQPNSWQWVSGRTYALGAGLHTLRLGGRRGQARADRVIVTDDPNFLPTEYPVNDVTPPSAVTGLVAAPSSSAIQLAWTNPAESGALRIVVRYRTDGSYPLGPGDGLPLVDKAGTPAAADGFTHNGTSVGTEYSYAVFALDFVGNVSNAATVQSIPVGDPPPTVGNLHRTDTAP